MQIGEALARLDEWIIDRIFQPVIDHFPGSLSPWQLGLNFQLGSLIVQAFAIGIPLLLFGVSWLSLFQDMLAWGAGLIMFLGFCRMQPMVKTGHLNPFREMLRALRLIALAFLVYEILQVTLFAPAVSIPRQLGVIGDIFFLAGLYFMSCRHPPPKTRRRPALKGRLAGQGSW